MKILCIGKSGQVASALAERAADQSIDLFCIGRPEFDVLIRDNIEEAIEQHEPTLIVNASAYTKVDAAESDDEAAYALNEVAPRDLARACARNSIPFIHISTDYVFNGQSDSPYREEDPTGPLGVYGRSKLSGELEVSDALKEHIILRTSWVYGPHNPNFVMTMLRLAEERGGASVVDDQIGTPTSAFDIADAILVISSKINEQPEAVKWGTYHLTANGHCSWADFAKLIFDLYDDKSKRTTNLTRIPTADYPTPAARPMNSRLSTQKLTSAFGIKTRPWQEGVKETVERLLAEPT